MFEFMPKCQWDDSNTCKICTFQSKYPNVIRNCPGKPIDYSYPKSPSLLKRGLNFSSAMVSHLTNGLKLVDNNLIQERFKICQGCEAFASNPDDKSKGKCLDCGCPINLQTIILNKLSHISESCPRNKWGPINKKEGNNEETIPSQENSQLQQGGCRPCQR